MKDFFFVSLGFFFYRQTFIRAASSNTIGSFLHYTLYAPNKTSLNKRRSALCIYERENFSSYVTYINIYIVNHLSHTWTIFRDLPSRQCWFWKNVSTISRANKVDGVCCLLQVLADGRRSWKMDEDGYKYTCMYIPRIISSREDRCSIKQKRNDALEAYTSLKKKTSKMIVWITHKIALSLALCRLIFDSPLVHFFLFLLRYTITSETTYGKTRGEREKLLNYGRCLQWYVMFEKEKVL